MAADLACSVTENRLSCNFFVSFFQILNTSAQYFLFLVFKINFQLLLEILVNFELSKIGLSI